MFGTVLLLVFWSLFGHHEKGRIHVPATGRAVAIFMKPFKEAPEHCSAVSRDKQPFKIVWVSREWVEFKAIPEDMLEWKCDQ